jgi:hypothetical protein
MGGLLVHGTMGEGPSWIPRSLCEAIEHSKCACCLLTDIMSGQDEEPSRVGKRVQSARVGTARSENDQYEIQLGVLGKTSILAIWLSKDL